MYIHCVVHFVQGTMYNYILEYMCNVHLPSLAMSSYNSILKQHERAALSRLTSKIVHLNVSYVDQTR